MISYTKIKIARFGKWFKITLIQPILLFIGFTWNKWTEFEPYVYEYEEDIRGKTVVVTGANSGIGKAVVMEFVKRGAIVIMACRNIPKAKLVTCEIKYKYPDAELILVQVDLSDLNSVRKCAKEIRYKCKKIHILMNNAGCLYTSEPIKKTGNDFEIHMGSNYLGHFLFTNLLLDLIKNGAPSRIVFTGSSLLLTADLDLNDLMLDKKGYFGFRNFGPYSNSKLALLYFATELSERLKGSGVNVYTLCPGYVETEVFRNEFFYLQQMLTKMTLLVAGSPVEKACETMLYCSLSKKLANESGKMYHFQKPFDCVNRDIQKFDRKEIRRLWEMSERLTGAQFLT